MNRQQRRTLLAALQPAADFALARATANQETRFRTDAPAGLKVTALSADTSELMIYGAIGGDGWFSDGVNAADVAASLKAITTPNLFVRINSPGGDVFDGVAIHTQLARHPATVTTFNDGIAASAASFIAMAGDRIVTEQGAMWMLHAASTFTHGTGNDHRESADLLDKVTSVIAEFYALRCGSVFLE